MTELMKIAESRHTWERSVDGPTDPFEAGWRAHAARGAGDAEKDQAALERDWAEWYALGEKPAGLWWRGVRYARGQEAPHA